MSIPTALPAAILETILTRLATLFLIGAGGDQNAARHAASEMLAAYHPETTDELRLAANIVSFSFQALEALAQAATPDMPLTRVLRLRGSAVSLSRESAKAERRLAQLQKSRDQPMPAQIPEPVSPKVEKAVALIQDTGKITAAAKANNLTWTQAYQQRRREARIAANIQKAQAKVASMADTAVPTRPDQSQTTAQAAA